MAENTQVDQVENKMVVLHYDTWGSFGQHGLDIAVLRDGTIVDPRKIRYPWDKGVEKEIQLPNGVKIIAKHKDSRKNAHKIVKVPRDQVLVVYSITRTSGNSYPNLEIISDAVENAEVKMREEVEVKEEGNKRVKNYYEVEYIEIVMKDGKKIEAPVERRYLRTESELLGKPVVTLTILSTEIVASGDTYHVRDVLKALGFKWNSSSKTWTRPASSDINEIIQKLSEKAEVNVKKF